MQITTLQVLKCIKITNTFSVVDNLIYLLCENAQFNFIRFKMHKLDEEILKLWQNSRNICYILNTARINDALSLINCYLLQQPTLEYKDTR